MFLRPTARLLGAALAGPALLALAGCSGAGIAGNASADGVQTFAPGSRPAAPTLHGTTLSGSSFSSTSDAGHVLVVNFWASWCPPCQDEAQTLAQVAEDTAHQGVRFLGVDVRDQRAQAVAYQKHYAVPYPSLFDPESQTLLAFHEPVLPTSPPTTLVIDRHGRVAAVITGGAEFTTLEPLVQQVAAEPA